MDSKKFDGMLLLTDIDGTFIRDDGSAVEANLEAVRYFQENGGRFGISSGRAFWTVEHAIPGWHELVNAPCILCNGACVFDAKSRTILHRSLLDPEVMLPLMLEMKAAFPELVFRFTCRKVNVFIDTDKPLDSYPMDEWYKIVVEGRTDRLAELYDRVYRRMGDRLAYSKSCDFFLEFLNPAATKGTMLEWIRAHMPEVRKIYAVGDYDNDLDMLRRADVPVCPSNGLASVVELCREKGIVAADNNAGTVADLIRRIS